MGADAKPQVRSSAWVAEQEAALRAKKETMSTAALFGAWRFHETLRLQCERIEKRLERKRSHSATDKLCGGAPEATELP